MHDIRHSVKIWLEDNMIHVSDEEKLLEVLEYFFKKCLQHGLFLHVLCAAAKDETSVEFMGRMFCCNFLRKSRL
jgi:hypothetical protein